MSGKVGLITGGGRGLGKNMAMSLARDGHDVIITYHSNKDAADDVVADIRALGRRALALELDVGALASFDGFVCDVAAALAGSFGCERFDFLVHNGGMGAFVPLLKASEADFDRFCNVHCKGVFFLTQKLLPHMNDGGRIIQISSGATRFFCRDYIIYAAMKAAAECFTRYLAKELGARRIRANTVAPGASATEFNGAFVRDTPNVADRMAELVPLGRVGIPEDVGGVVAFLCSDAAGWINGQRLEVSGGIHV